MKGETSIEDVVSLLRTEQSRRTKDAIRRGAHGSSMLMRNAQAFGTVARWLEGFEPRVKVEEDGK